VPPRCGTSYGLKHVAEEEICYMPNGIFIAAAIAEGFRVKRVSYASPNAQFNISATAWQRKNDVLRHRAGDRFLDTPTT
jgi:hypothetical protein